MSGQSSHGQGPGHETQDFTFKVGIWILPLSMVFLFLFVTVVTYFAVSSLGIEMGKKDTQGAKAKAQTVIAFKAGENEILTSYRWKDKAAGRVQIPVERAIQILAERAAKSPAAAKQP